MLASLIYIPEVDLGPRCSACCSFACVDLGCDAHEDVDAAILDAADGYGEARGLVAVAGRLLARWREEPSA